VTRVSGSGEAEPRGIVVFGANGSGKTTLGRELARVLGFLHMDIEDYYFAESAIPYTVARPRDECLKRMLDDIKKRRAFVLTACHGDFGGEIQAMYRLAVHLHAPLDLRVERVKQRSLERFGARVLEGGDMVEQERDFADFVAARPLTKIEQWAQTLTCPVLYVDGTEDWRVNAAKIANEFHRIESENQQ